MTEYIVENDYLLDAQRQFESGELIFEEFREIRRVIIAGLEAGQRLPETQSELKASADMTDTVDDDEIAVEEDFYDEEDDGTREPRKPSSLDRIDTSLLTNAILFAAGVAFIMLLYVLFM